MRVVLAITGDPFVRPGTRDWAFARLCPLFMALICSLGCAAGRGSYVPMNYPVELKTVPQPSYTVSAPDRLFIAVTVRPKPAPEDYRITPDDVLSVEIKTAPAGAPDSKPIYADRFVLVAPDGKIRIAEFGELKVGGSKLDEIAERLRKLLKEHPDIQAADPRVAVQLSALHESIELLTGDRLVRPDGTVNLSPYGEVRVQGLRLDEIKNQVRGQILQERPDLVWRLESSDEMYIDVEVTGFNSQVCYVQYEVQTPTLFPITGTETVLDAVVRAGSATDFAERNDVYLVRVNPFEGGEPEILPVCLRDIIELGATETNYQLRPGDRIVVPPRRIVVLQRFLSPFTQVADSFATTGLLWERLISNFKVNTELER